MAYDTEGRLSLDANDFIASADDAADASDDLGDAADDTQNSLFEFDAAGAAASGAIVGAGGAMQGALDNSRDWRESLDRTASTMDITSDEAEDLATSMSDETFELDDVTASMDNFASMGVDTKEEMEDLALASDNIADATGTTAESVSDNLAPVVRGLDGDLDAITESQDAFTLAARDTGTSVEDLSGTISRLDFEELNEMGLQTEETTGLVSKFSEETGYTGKQLQSNFNQAVGEADGELDELIEELGLGPDVLDEWDESLEENKGITDEHAESVSDNTSTMDMLRSRFDDAMLSAGNLLGPIDALAPVMMALGSAGMFLSTVNVSTLIPSIAGLQAALLPIMTTILPLIAVVGALAAAWKTDFLGIQGIVGDVVEWLEQTFDAFLGDVETWWNDSGQDILESVEHAFGRVEEVIGQTLEFIRDDVITPFISWLEDVWREHGEELAEEFAETWDHIAEKIDEVVSFIHTDVIVPFVETVEPIIFGFLDSVEQWWTEHGERVMQIVESLFEVVETVFSTAFENLIEAVSMFLSAVRGDWDGFAEGLENIVRNLFEVVETVFFEALNVLDALTNGWVEDNIELFELFWSNIETVFETALENIRLAVDAFLAILDGDFSSFAEAVEGIFSNMWEAIETIFSNGFEALELIVGMIVDTVVGLFEDLAAAIVGNSIIPDMIADIEAALETFLDWITGVWDLLGAFTDTFNSAKDAVEGLIDDLVSNVTETLGNLVDDVLGLGGDAADSFANGFNNVTPDSLDVPEMSIGGGTLAGQDLPEATIGGQSLNIPSLESGGSVDGDGLYNLHAGERVLPEGQVSDRGEAELAGASDPDAIAEAMRKVDRTDEVVGALERLATLLANLDAGDVKAKDVLRALDVAEDRRGGRNPLD